MNSFGIKVSLGFFFVLYKEHMLNIVFFLKKINIESVKLSVRENEPLQGDFYFISLVIN